MPTDSIVLYGQEVLRNLSDEIVEFNDEIKALIEHMYKILEESGGLGVAGPQVGINKRIFVYDMGDGKHAIINPKILKSSGEEISEEGCLSIPGLHGEVTRAFKVTITGIDENGKKIKLNAQGLQARLFQHETDHLDGVLFIDRANPDTLHTITPDEEFDEDDEE